MNPQQRTALAKDKVRCAQMLGGRVTIRCSSKAEQDAINDVLRTTKPPKGSRITAHYQSSTQHND